MTGRRRGRWTDRHHHLAAVAWLASWVLAAAGGSVFAAVERIPEWLGLYWAVTTVTSVGYGDVTPHTVPGHVVAVAVMLLVYPLWLIAFGLLTSWFMSRMLAQAETRIKNHVDRHHGGPPRDRAGPQDDDG